MRKLKDILEGNQPVLLTDTQKGLLITIQVAATPEQAYELSNGSSNSTAARDELVRLNLINVNSSQIQLTPNGRNALIANNLTDEMGHLTSEGDVQLKSFETNKQEYVNLESVQFKFLDSFIH